MQQLKKDSWERSASQWWRMLAPLTTGAALLMAAYFRTSHCAGRDSWMQVSFLYLGAGVKLGRKCALGICLTGQKVFLFGWDRSGYQDSIPILTSEDQWKPSLAKPKPVVHGFESIGITMIHCMNPFWPPICKHVRDWFSQNSLYTLQFLYFHWMTNHKMSVPDPFESYLGVQ